MPSVSKTLSDFNLKSTYNGVRWLNVTVDKTFNLSAIPDGSEITAAKITGSVRSQMFGGTFKAGSVTLATTTNNDAVTISKSVLTLFSGLTSFDSVKITFAYQSKGRSGYSQEYGYFTDIKLTVTYTPPYTKCTAPTSVTAAKTNVAPKETVRISWSGAKAGDYNPIDSYTVYRSTDNSTWTSLKSGITTTYLDVTAPSTNGSTYYYKVVTVGEVSGYNSSRSSATATVKCTFTAPTVSAVKIDSSTSAVYKKAGTSATLTWTGTNGTNNAISSYDVYEGSDKLGTTTSKTYSVTTPSAGTSVTFYILANGAHSDSSKVASPKLYGYSNPTAPTSVSVSATNVDASVSVTLSWSGAAAGSYNSVAGYRIMRATSATGTYSQIGEDIDSTATSGSTTVTSHATNGSSYFYKVITIGARSNSSQSSVYAELKTVWTAPTAPTVQISATTANPGTEVALSWSGASDGTNNPISAYNVYQSTGADYTLLETKAASVSSMVCTVGAAGTTTYYKVVAVGTKSGYDSADSNIVSVTANSKPSTPAILHPGNNAVTYNVSPRFILQAQVDAGRGSYDIMVSVDSGTPETIETISEGDSSEVILQYGSSLSLGSHTFEFTLSDGAGSVSDPTSVTITIGNTSWARTIARGVSIANTSISHQQEILQLYQQVNQILSYFGEESITIPELVGSTNPSPGPGKIGMFSAWGSQMADLQGALGSVFTVIGETPTAWTQATAGMIPTASVIAEIRSAITYL